MASSEKKTFLRVQFTQCSSPHSTKVVDQGIVCRATRKLSHTIEEIGRTRFPDPQPTPSITLGRGERKFYFLYVSELGWGGGGREGPRGRCAAITTPRPPSPVPLSTILKDFFFCPGIEKIGYYYF